MVKNSLAVLIKHILACFSAVSQICVELILTLSEIQILSEVAVLFTIELQRSGAYCDKKINKVLTCRKMYILQN